MTASAEVQLEEDQTTDARSWNLFEVVWKLSSGTRRWRRGTRRRRGPGASSHRPWGRSSRPGGRPRARPAGPAPRPLGPRHWNCFYAYKGNLAGVASPPRITYPSFQNWMELYEPYALRHLELRLHVDDGRDEREPCRGDQHAVRVVRQARQRRGTCNQREN